MSQPEKEVELSQTDKVAKKDKGSSCTPKAKAKAVVGPKSKAKASATASKASDDKEVPKPKAKSKAKAKAKVKAAAKAAATKAAAKAAAKAKGKVANEGSPKGSPNVDDDPEPKKKAVPKKSVKDIKKRLLQASSTALDQANASDDDEDETGVDQRDRCKTKKFETLLARGEVPTHIVDMLTHGMKDSKAPRAFKTKLINSLFNRDDSGKLTMTPHAPFFTAWKQTHFQQRMSEKDTAFPMTVFCGKFFNNNQQALQHAVDVGDVQIVEQNGRQFYSFVTLEHEKCRLKVAVQKLTQVEKKVDDDAQKQLSDAFDSLDFNFKKIATTQPSSSSSGSSQVVIKAIADGPVSEVAPALSGDVVFERVKDVIEDAKNAAERICKDIMKLVGKLSDDAKTTQSLLLAFFILLQSCIPGFSLVFSILIGLVTQQLLC